MTANTQHQSPPDIAYSCEICGQDGFSDDQMRAHMDAEHLKGALSCPFCDLASSEVTPSEMTLHVNSAHLEYLTPEQEDVAFLEDDGLDSDFDSIWQLEKGAKEGLTNGVDDSPTTTTKTSTTTAAFKAAPQSKAAPTKLESPMSTASSSSTMSPVHSGAIQKRFKTNEGSPSKSGLTLNIRPSWAPLASHNSSTSSLAAANNSELFQCPMCAHQSDNPAKLEEHVNRSHLDPESPISSSSLAAVASSSSVTPSSLPCPLCSAHYSTSLELERHVNRDHCDVLSPMVTKRGGRKELNAQDNNGNCTECPVCNMQGFHNQNQLAEHIDSHFQDDAQQQQQQPASSSSSKLLSRIGSGDAQSISSMSSSSSTTSSTSCYNQRQYNDYLLAQEIERRERERRRHEEQREFDQLRAQFGMIDNDGNFHSQSISNMQNAVYRGEMSVVDYYERQTELRNAEKHGMDDGRSQTKHLMPSLKALCQTAQGVAQTYLCSVVDHHSSSYGDKGWGCGYRNLQMLLSSLAHHTPFSERLAVSKSSGVASISRLQSLIESAWAKGFDVQGADQLGGKLVSTRKWIGATEIVAFLTAHNVKTELVDFHAPTAKDGTHPKLFQWVLEYFRERARSKTFTPPLYLQHQGHSRTIVGIEVMASSGHFRLLVFDPSHSRSQMSSLLKCGPGSSEAAEVMRMLRKSPASMKCKQYQIVSVTGVFASDKEAAGHKVIRSKRIP